MNVHVIMDTALRSPGSSGTVMASIDGDHEEEQLIIADVSRDEAWLSMPMGNAPFLTHWR